MTALLLAFGFLTTLPVRLSDVPTIRHNAQSVLYYPVVGLVLAILLSGLGLGLVWLDLPMVLVSSLVVAAWVRLTGALHLDGLADSADGLAAAHKDKDKILAIMKDPNCGAMGVVAIVLCLLVKFAAVYAVLVVAEDWQVWAWVMVLAVVLPRMMILLMFLTMPYVSKNGIASSFGKHLSHRAVRWVLWAWALGLMAFGFWWKMWLVTAWAMGGLLVFLWWYRRCWLGVLGGMTGDVIGGGVELSEVLILVLSVAVLA